MIWTGERLIELATDWPASVEPKAGQYFWRVLAHFQSGDEPAASPLVSFELLAP